MFYQRPKESIASKHLVSWDFAEKSLAIAGKEQKLSIWLSPKERKQKVSGGHFGEQTISTSKWPKPIKKMLLKSIDDIKKFTNLDLRYTGNRSNADIHVFYDKKIDVDNYPDLLGLAMYNNINSKGMWEIFINKSEISSENQLFYTLIHEIGHSLGLEHPHDATDGDFYKSNSIINSAPPSQTIMSSGKPNYSVYPSGYQANDIKALTKVWGKDSHFKVNDFIDEIIQPSVELCSSIINLPIDMTNHFIIKGNGSPDGLIKCKINDRELKTRQISEDGTWKTRIKPIDITKIGLGLDHTLTIEQISKSGHLSEIDGLTLNILPSQQTTYC